MTDFQEVKLSNLPLTDEVSPEDWTYVVKAGGGSRKTRVSALIGASITVTPEMFGGKADAVYSSSSFVSGTDNYQSIKDALAYLEAKTSVSGRGGILRFGVGSYRCSQGIDLKGRHTIEGCNAAGMAGVTNCEIVFPQDTTGVYINRGGTLSGAPINPATTGADGSEIRNITLRSLGGSNRGKHGIECHARFLLREVNVFGFPGNGVEINSTLLAGTNINYWRAYGGRIGGCHHGINVDGGDTNGGAGFAIEVNANRGFGIKDSSFLGCDWYGCGADGNGTLSYAYYAGSLYYVIDEELAQSTEPGTNPAVWALKSVLGSNVYGHREWTAGNNLEWVRGGPIGLLDDNSVSTAWGGYLGEPNQPPAVILYRNASVGGYRSAGVIGNGMVWNSGVLQNIDNIHTGGLTTTAAGDEVESLKIRNQASLNANRRTRITTYLSYKPDGVTHRPLAALVGSAPGSSAGYRTNVALEYYDPGTDTLTEALRLEGHAKTATPGEDNAWSFGTAAKRWLKGWFNTLNVSSLPVYADNSAAISGGLAVGDIYRTLTGTVMVRY